MSNGNVRCLADAKANLTRTGAAGVMSACGLLDDPALFDDSGGPFSCERPRDMRHRIAMAVAYLHCCDAEPASAREMRDHIHSLLQGLPEVHPSSPALPP